MVEAKKGSRRGPYAKTAAVQERIIAACSEVFAESGYRATTMKEIADRAGISQRGLVHHFGSKEELLAKVIEARETQLTPLIAPLGDAIGSFESMLNILNHDSERPGVIELNSLLVAEGASIEHPAHEHYRVRYEELRHYFEVAFEQLRAAGAVTSDLSSDSLASSFVALLEGLQVQWLYNRHGVDIDTTLRGFLRTVISGYPQRVGRTAALKA